MMAKYFTIETDPRLFKCSCKECPAGFHVLPTETLLHTLDVVREAYGKPITITSGVRCPVYNAKVGGVVDGEHTTGHAADLFSPDSFTRYRLLAAALKVGVSRIGVGSNFFHIGVGGTFPQSCVWLYVDFAVAH